MRGPPAGAGSPLLVVSGMSLATLQSPGRMSGAGPWVVPAADQLDAVHLRNAPLREADILAGDAGRNVLQTDDIQRAIDGPLRRAGRVRARARRVVSRRGTRPPRTVGRWSPKLQRPVDSNAQTTGVRLRARRSACRVRHALISRGRSVSRVGPMAEASVRSKQAAGPRGTAVRVRPSWRRTASSARFSSDVSP